jgi:hypothetical protein
MAGGQTAQLRLLPSYKKSFACFLTLISSSSSAEARQNDKADDALLDQQEVQVVAYTRHTRVLIYASELNKSKTSPAVRP